jgi:hypothetical protein
MRFLWLELFMSRLPSSDVAHEYKSHDGHWHSSICWRSCDHLLISELRTDLSFYLDLSINVAAGYEYGISHFSHQLSVSYMNLLGLLFKVKLSTI